MWQGATVAPAGTAAGFPLGRPKVSASALRGAAASRGRAVGVRVRCKDGGAAGSSNGAGSEKGKGAGKEGKGKLPINPLPKSLTDSGDPLEVGTGLDVDALGEPTSGNFRVKMGVAPNWMQKVLLGLEDAYGVLDMPLEEVQEQSQALLQEMGISAASPESMPNRAIFCNRALNLRSIKAIGYDMDYTLIHYNVNEWEGLSFEYGLDYLRSIGCPVEGLKFKPELAIRGLILDKKLGNLVKVDRFGFVKRAMHGTRMLNPREMYKAYGRELVKYADTSRWKFINTLFSISEAVLFSQLVDRLDSGYLPEYVVGRSYMALYDLVAKAQTSTIVEGKLKQEILKDPERFVELDPETPATLLDQRNAGKQLVLITNSDFQYTEAMMQYAFNRFLPAGMTWRDLFSMVIVQANKPAFFEVAQAMYEIVTDDGLMQPVADAAVGGIFCGGTAAAVQDALGVVGSDMLYVGDHIYTDAALAKTNLSWRTALIIRELEEEVAALSVGRPHRAKMKELLEKKELLGQVFNAVRTQRQRKVASEASLGEVSELLSDEARVNEALGQLVLHLEALDSTIAPMIETDGAHFNERWGFLSRAGVNDKSLLSNQIEKHADIYTSRVSNFFRSTPYSYFRSPMQTLAHDRNLTKYSSLMAGPQPPNKPMRGELIDE
eukprot:jgi/Tetstr1/446037/TSEL_033639.t1